MPDRPLDELEPTGELLDRRTLGNDAVERGVEPDYFGRRGGRCAHLAWTVEIERRRADPDEVLRRVGYGPVDAEDGELDLLPGSRLAGEHDAVGCVESLDQLATGLTQHQRKLPVHPDLGIVVDDQLEDDGRTGDVEPSEGPGQGDLRAVPVEGESPVRPPGLEGPRLDRLPGGIVEVHRLRVGTDVVGAIRRARRPEIGSGGMVVDLDHLDIAVAPLRLDQRRTLRRAEIHHGGRKDDRQINRGLCRRKRGPGQEGEHRPREHRRGAPHHIAPAVVGRSACRTLTT